MGFWTLEICADNGGVWWITAEARLDEEGEHPPIQWWPVSTSDVSSEKDAALGKEYCKKFATKEEAEEYLITAALCGKIVDKVRVVHCDG